METFKTMSVKICKSKQDWAINLFDFNNNNWYSINKNYAKACGLSIGKIYNVDVKLVKGEKYTNIEKITKVY